MTSFIKKLIDSQGPHEAEEVEVDHGNKGAIAWNRGIPRAEETKAKQSAANKGQVPKNKGTEGLQKHSAEARAKIAAAQKPSRITTWLDSNREWVLANIRHNGKFKKEKWEVITDKMQKELGLKYPSIYAKMAQWMNKQAKNTNQ